MKFYLSVLFIGGLRCLSHAAEALDEWLIIQVRKDEKLLSSALWQTDGTSLDLLENAKTYVPFFLEPPEGHTFGSASQKDEFDKILTKWNADSFLSGGYIYILKFPDAPPLYATSAGDWDGTIWHSLNAGKDVVIEPSRAWNGSGNDYLYATILSGIPPRIIEYDQRCEIVRTESFDVNASDLERRLATAKEGYGKNGSPILEMISLFEYLKDADASWREVDLSGQFNLRNQHLRDDERERLKSSPNLKRIAAINELQSRMTQEGSQMPRGSSWPMDTRKELKAPALSSGEKASASAQSPSMRWPMLAAVIVAVLGVPWLLLNGKRGNNG